MLKPTLVVFSAFCFIYGTLVEGRDLSTCATDEVVSQRRHFQQLRNRAYGCRSESIYGNPGVTGRVYEIAQVLFFIQNRVNQAVSTCKYNSRDINEFSVCYQRESTAVQSHLNALQNNSQYLLNTVSQQSPDDVEAVGACIQPIVDSAQSSVSKIVDNIDSCSAFGQRREVRSLTRADWTSCASTEVGHLRTTFNQLRNRIYQCPTEDLDGNSYITDHVYDIAVVLFQIFNHLNAMITSCRSQSIDVNEFEDCVLLQTQGTIQADLQNLDNEVGNLTEVVRQESPGTDDADLVSSCAQAIATSARNSATSINTNVETCSLSRKLLKTVTPKANLIQCGTEVTQNITSKIGQLVNETLECLSDTLDAAPGLNDSVNNLVNRLETLQYDAGNLTERCANSSGSSFARFSLCVSLGFGQIASDLLAVKLATANVVAVAAIDAPELKLNATLCVASLADSTAQLVNNVAINVSVCLTSNNLLGGSNSYYEKSLSVKPVKLY